MITREIPFSRINANTVRHCHPRLGSANDLWSIVSGDCERAFLKKITSIHLPDVLTIPMYLIPTLRRNIQFLGKPCSTDVTAPTSRGRG